MSVFLERGSAPGSAALSFRERQAVNDDRRVDAGIARHPGPNWLAPDGGRAQAAARDRLAAREATDD